MISKDTLQEALYNTVVKASCQIPQDIRDAFEASIATETSELSKIAFQNTLRSLDISCSENNLACPDTGWPLFFIKIGCEAKIEGGIIGLEETAKRMVEKATTEGFLRSTMKHPLTGYDPGGNVGVNVPGFTYKHVPGEDLEITFVPKGGGSECFGGTRYRVVAFADGTKGIQKFIIDSYISACRAGAICPPAVLGIGIGGTANICMELAKEAATLRLIGSRHPDPDIAEMEDDLYRALSMLKIGAMGSGGNTSVFAVNIEYAYTHIAGIAVGISSNCFVARRATMKVSKSGIIDEIVKPDWFDRQ